MKKKATIGILLAVAAIVAILLWKFVFSEKNRTVDASEAAYVVSVAALSGQEGAVGAVNRFSGVVETQETWSVEQNQDSTVKEILVSVGDEVRAGQALFTYDIEKFQSDQEQAEIELERMNNELETITKMMEQLQADQKKAAASEQADYTIRIQDAELQKKQKELDIKSKTISIEKLKDNQKNATVISEIDGVVRSINNGTSSEYDMSGDNNAFMTIMKTGDLRIKGTINEQNIGQIMVGSPVRIHSRVEEDRIWTGEISDINTDSTVNNQNSYYYGSGGDSSSNYNFYVSLEDSTGLMIGQHVYLELDYGQGEMEEREGIWIPLYFVEQTENGNFVWADNGAGKLERRSVATGEEDEDLMMVEILEGLTPEDKLAFPEETLAEGMPTIGDDDA